ncbi:ATP-binding protein [Jannaschia ovalis]
MAGAPISQPFMMAIAGALAAIFLAVQAASWLTARAAERKLRIVLDFLEFDSAPGFCTDTHGVIFAQNRSAVDRFGNQDGATMTRALEPLFASPDAVVHRLKTAAETASATREDVVTRRGHVRIAVHAVPGGHLWRLEDLVDRPPRAADGIGLPMLTFGPSGTILYMNESLRSMTGQRAKRVRDLFDDHPLQNGVVNTLRTRDGAERVRVVLSAPVNGRQEVFVLPAGEDSDGRVAFDALPVALLRLDPRGHVVAANRAARELLPPSAGGDERRLAAMVEGLGRSISEWVTEASAGRGLNRSEVVRVTGAETETFLQITLGRPVGDGEAGLIAVLNDATELKTMEAQFVQSQKMQAIGQLAGGVAHDFNNLLTAISGHCDLLLLRHGEGDEDHADLTQITQNANRAAALVGQLLAFSRKQTLEMQDIDLRDTLGDLTHLLNRLVGERITLRLSHDPALIPIRGDRRQLEQVLMNLVVNARDAMPEGGEIRIETRCRFLDAPMHRDRVTVPAGQYVVITVSDEGCGIPEDALARIFEPFFTTKRPGEGTGLGLSMAYGIIKQSGGYIFADSEAERGTVFSLYFPAIGEVAANAQIDLLAPVMPEVLQPARPVPDEAPALRLVEMGFGNHAAPASAPAALAGEDAEARASEARETPAAASSADVTGATPGEVRPDLELDAVSHGVASADADADQDDEAPNGATPSEPAEDVHLRAGIAEICAVQTDDRAEEVSDREMPVAEMSEQAASDPTSADQPCDSSTAAEMDAPADVAARRAEPDCGVPEAEDAETRDADCVDPEGPAATADGASPPSRDDMPERARDPLVLLVEDEAPVRAFASRALRLRGYSVLEAASAEDALKTLEDEGLEVDLFVTDVMMPGLDGPTWVRRALQSRPDVRTIFVSGYTQDALSETSAPIPNATFLAKPFSLSELTRTVERALA